MAKLFALLAILSLHGAAAQKALITFTAPRHEKLAVYFGESSGRI
jgi:hypothetical protein